MYANAAPMSQSVSMTSKKCNFSTSKPSAGNKHDADEPVSSLLGWDHHEAVQSLKPKREFRHEIAYFWNLAIAHLLMWFHMEWKVNEMWPVLQVWRRSSAIRKPSTTSLFNRWGNWRLSCVIFTWISVNVHSNVGYSSLQKLYFIKATCFSKVVWQANML